MNANNETLAPSNVGLSKHSVGLSLQWRTGHQDPINAHCPPLHTPATHVSRWRHALFKPIPRTSLSCSSLPARSRALSRPRPGVIAGSSLASAARPGLPEAERAHYLRDPVVERLRRAARADAHQRVLDLLHARAAPRGRREPRVQVVRGLLICSGTGRGHRCEHTRTRGARRTGGLGRRWAREVDALALRVPALSPAGHLVLADRS